MPSTRENLLSLGSRATANILIDYIIEYFSFFENKNAKAIEKDFIPFIMNFSPKHLGGTRMNLSIFKEKLTLNQEIYVKLIYKNCKSALISTPNFRNPSLLCMFLNSFKALRELDIILQSDEVFIPSTEKYKFETLVITCIPRPTWTDPILQMIINSEKTIKNFSLRQSLLSNAAIKSLFENKLTRLSLIDIIVYSIDERDLLISCIFSRTELKTLELIYTKKHTFLNHYDNFNTYFFSELHHFQANIECLSFTLDQAEIIHKFNLQNLKNLKTLVVYYTTEREFHNITVILDEIQDLQLNGILDIQNIRFIEYFSEARTLRLMNNELINHLKSKSVFFIDKIKEKSLIPIEISPYSYDAFKQLSN